MDIVFIAVVGQENTSMETATIETVIKNGNSSFRYNDDDMKSGKTICGL